MCALGASRRRAIVFVGVRYDQAMRQHVPGFPTVSIVLPIVFSVARHCSCAGGFSPAVARSCIVIPVAFPIADRLYLGKTSGGGGASNEQAASTHLALLAQIRLPHLRI